MKKVIIIKLKVILKILLRNGDQSFGTYVHDMAIFCWRKRMGLSVDDVAA